VKVVVTAAAELDLIEIGEYIALDDLPRAVSFVQELIDHCHRIGETPRLYPFVPRYEHWGIRRCVHGNYLIFYRAREETVEIVHVLHGARDYEPLLFPEA